MGQEPLPHGMPVFPVPAHGALPGAPGLHTAAAAAAMPEVPGLDPAVVAFALAAGAPLADLSKFGNMAQSRPPRVFERPGGARGGRPAVP